MSKPDIAEAVSFFLKPGEVTEVRAFGRNGSYPITWSGYFDNPDKMAAEVAEITGKAAGVYFVPNPVNSALLSRAVNRLRVMGKGDASTSDTDILRRRWLLVDCDPERPSGISSTDTEHEAALLKAQEMRNALSSEGWPEPVYADSGNGGHLLYRVDLPVDEGGLIQRCLEALAFRFDDATVHIDRTVHNPARISRLYGCMNRKGDDTADRPHRLSKLLHAPDALEIVPVELLAVLAATLPEEPKPDKPTKVTVSDGWDLEQWIQDHGVPVSGPSPWNGGRKWIFDECPWNSEHRNRSAYIVQFAGGAIAAGCHHNGCAGKGWRDLRVLYQPDAYDKAGKTGHDGPSSANRKVALLTRFYPRPFTEHILENIQFLWEGERGLLWRFDSAEGLWRPDGESFISAYFRRDLSDIGDDLKKKTVVQEIVADVAGCSYHPNGLPEPPVHLLPFKNGVYDLSAGGFRGLQADDHFTAKLPHNYNPAAKPTLLPEIIGNLLPEAETVTLYELIAYSLWRDYPYQKVFFLLGGGGNGKSLFTQTILSHFLGKENTVQIGLKSLQEERFAAGQLHRKLANVAGESPYCDLQSTETLKSLCGWDLLTADRKYLSPIRFKNHAKLIFVCNQLPKTHDTTTAFYRRPFIIEFPQQFPDDPTLPMRITENPEEFEWLAVQAVRTLQDLRARNFIFTRHQGLDQVRHEYEKRSNPLVRFITEHCSRDGDGHIWKWQFSERFQDFLQENAFVRWSDTRLGIEMKSLGYETGKRTNEQDKGWSAWLGLTWRHPPGFPGFPGFPQPALEYLGNGCGNPGNPGNPGGNERGTEVPSVNTDMAAGEKPSPPSPSSPPAQPGRPVPQGVAQPGPCAWCGSRAHATLDGEYICCKCNERRYSE